MKLSAIYDSRASSCLVLYDHDDTKFKALTTRYQYMNTHFYHRIVLVLTGTTALNTRPASYDRTDQETLGLHNTD